MIRRVLVALDETPGSTGVFETALLLIQRFQADLLVFRAIEVPEPLPAAAHNSPEDMTKLILHREQEKLDRLTAGHDHVKAIPPQMLESEPWHLILETARQFGVDLIVIGSHTYHRWELVLGTTASKVVNHADRSVFVVHQQEPSTPGPAS